MEGCFHRSMRKQPPLSGPWTQGEDRERSEGTNLFFRGGRRFGTVAFDLHPPLRSSCGGERLALGRDARQQIVPGLSEGGDPFSEQLSGHRVGINTSFGEFGKHLVGMRG